MALFHISFTSKFLAGPADVNVIMPDLPYGRDPRDFYSSQKKYKVLWLLHGTYGDYSDWLRKSNIELYACEKNVAVVMPSAGNTNYVDWPSFAMGYRVNSYFFEELMPMVRGWLPVSEKRKDNFVAGLSMGGRGAGLFAFEHPELFGGAYIFSSVPVPLKEPDPNDPFAAREYNLISNFGGLENYRNSDLNLWDLARRHAENHTDLPKLYYACGNRDPIAYANFLAFHDYAGKIGLKAEFYDVPGYGHEWRFWDLCIQDALERFIDTEKGTYPFDRYKK